MESKKYKMLTKGTDGLRRIEALRDIPRFNVKKGDLGGWIEKERNLSQDGDCWVGEEARVYAYAAIKRNAEIFGNARIFGSAEVSGSAKVFGDAKIFGHVSISVNAQICGSAKVYGYARVYTGMWEKSPLYIQGTRDALTTSGPDEINVRYESHSVGKWLEEYKQLLEDKEYSDEEVKEYLGHLTYAAQWLKDFQSSQ